MDFTLLGNCPTRTCIHRSRQTDVRLAASSQVVLQDSLKTEHFCMLFIRPLLFSLAVRCGEFVWKNGGQRIVFSGDLMNAIAGHKFKFGASAKVVVQVKTKQEVSINLRAPDPCRFKTTSQSASGKHSRSKCSWTPEPIRGASRRTCDSVVKKTIPFSSTNMKCSLRSVFLITHSYIKFSLDHKGQESVWATADRPAALFPSAHEADRFLYIHLTWHCWMRDASHSY